MSKKIKKIVSVTTSVATIAWISGIGMLLPLASQAVTIVDGDTIKTVDSPDVYIAKYAGSKKFKRLILNPQVFESYGHLSWANIKTVTQAELNSFVTSELVKPDIDYKVYKLTPNGDVGLRQWLNMTAGQFEAAGYDWDSIYTINATDRNNYTSGSDITAGVTPPQAGTLSVSLASNTAPATTLVDGSAAANMASFTFTAPSSGAVKVTTLKLKRLGVSADTTLSNIYLYNGVNRLTDSATVSSGVITWTNSAGVFTVPAGSMYTVIVKSDIADSVAGETVGVGINAVADIVTDGASVSGSFPMNGSIHSTANATLAGVSFADADPDADGTPSPQSEFVLWESVATITTRAVDLKYITFRQIGSVLQNDLQNFKLLIDGVQTGSTVATVDANSYITFDLSSAPKRLQTGSRTFKILVDIVGGSSRTTSLSLRNAADAVFSDTEFGSNVLVQAASAAFSTSVVSSATQTIGTGALTITKRTDSPSATVVKDASNVTLAKFDVKATGENVKVENLTVTVDDDDISSAFTLRNAALYADGVQIGSTFSMRATSDTTATSTISLGSSLIVVPGTTRLLEVKADIYDNDGTNDVAANDTLIVRITAGSSNAQRMTALTYFNAPTSDVTGNTLSVKTGTLTLSKYTGYTNQTAVPPKDNFKIGEWRLTAGTTENVGLTALDPDYDNTGNTILGVATDFSSCYFTYADKTSASKSTVTSTSDSYSINYTLTAGATIPIALYCTARSAISGNTVVELDITATTVQSATSYDVTETAGQTITWGSGQFTITALETPLDQLTYGNRIDVEAANFELNATNDSYTISLIGIKFLNATNAAIVKDVKWYDGSTLLNVDGAPTFFDGAYATSTVNLVVPANTTKTITAKVSLNSVGTNNSTPYLNASTTLTSLYKVSSGGTPTYSNYTAGSSTYEGNAIYVVRTYPTISSGGSSSYTVTNDNSQAVYKFSIAPSVGGSLGVKQVSFDLAWTDLGNYVEALELDTIKFLRGSTDISDIVTITDGSGNTAEAGSGVTEADTTRGIVVNFTSEELISTATEYTIKATPRLFEKGTTSSDQIVITLNTDSKTDYRYIGDAAGDGVWSMATDNTGATEGAAYLIWSDRSTSPHVATSGSASADWFNGYLVKNLALDGVVVKP